MNGIILIYFLFKGLRIILEKYSFYQKFEVYAKGKSKLTYELSKCDFCMNVHLSIIATSIVGLLTGFELFHLIMPLVSASIHNTIKR